MIETAVLVPGRGFRPTASILYYLQRVLAPWGRDVGASGLARALRRRHPPPPLLDARDAARLDALRADGEADLGVLLGPAERAEILEWLAGRPAFDLDDHARPFDPLAPPADVRIGCYPLAQVIACPHLLRLANHPSVLGVVGGYLGCAPTISALSLRWSYPRPARAQHHLQTFHRDPDDWRFVKLFVYLSDVDTDGGPHEFIRGSHRERGSLRSRLLDAAAAASRYPGALSRVTGPAGKGFLVDTFGWHRGAPPVRGVRLMLTVQYSILPVYAFVLRPVPRDLVRRDAAGPARVDPWVNRRIVA